MLVGLEHQENLGLRDVANKVRQGASIPRGVPELVSPPCPTHRTVSDSFEVKAPALLENQTRLGRGGGKAARRGPAQGNVPAEDASGELARKGKLRPPNDAVAVESALAGEEPVAMAQYHVQ